VTPVSQDELRAWSRYVYAVCGIHLDDSKGYLIETRLGPLLRETGSATFSELHYKVKADTSLVLRRKVVDAITTGETSFFRDTSPFDLLKHKVIPDLIDRRRKALGSGRPVPIRIWSAACSSGQEVYSIAIVLKELLGSFQGYDIRVLGTDISDKAVASASYGHYNKMELERGMPSDKIHAYFSAVNGAWKVRDDIRALVSFRTLNLLEPLAFPVRHDIVFCRNVAIYFTEPDRARLFENLGRVLAPDGFLIIGSTESLTGLCPQFEARRYLRSVYYQLRVGL
jgi:chemotaxis protein methyltransferase CheR